MLWTQTQPGTPLLSLADVTAHLRIADTQGQDDYLDWLVTAATSYAENVMGCSLITRTITATFYSNENLILPRGPVQSITSVSVNGSPVDVSAYSIEQKGTTTLLRYNNGTIQPMAAPATLVVIYAAGYGDAPTDVPADILAAIKCYVGLLYENREVAQDRTITPVPFLDDFFRLRALEVGIG
jgi:uncharacterized phiE125 gp8 family phage protein